MCNRECSIKNVLNFPPDRFKALKVTSSFVVCLERLYHNDYPGTSVEEQWLLTWTELAAVSSGPYRRSDPGQAT